MRRMLAMFLAAVIFLDIICLGVIIFVPRRSPGGEPADDIFSKAHVVAAGNNIITDEMLIQAKDRSNTGGYDFAMVYENIKQTVGEADVAILTQEPLISSAHSVSGSGLFNCPPQLGDELVKTGFNVVNMATPHMLDYGEEGLASTLAYWQEKPEVTLLGAYPGKDEANDIHMKEVNGIKFAFVAFTQSTGGNSLPENSEMVIPLASEETRLSEKISFSKQKADVVIVLADWGNEYETRVTDEQRNLAVNMASWGADVIIGTHPRVIQQAEYIDNPDGTRSFVAYSLGNLVSSASRAEQLLGGLLSFDVVKNIEERTVSVENIGISGVITHYGISMSKIRVYPLADYNDELALAHGIKETEENFGMRYLGNLLDSEIDKKFTVTG